MDGLQWLLDLILMVLLAVTLLHAVRLERALGVLKRDRPAFEQLIAGLNGSTREAQAGIDGLRAAADGAGRSIDQQIRGGLALKEDLRLLTERGEQMADRLEQLVHLAREQTLLPSRAKARLTFEPEEVMGSEPVAPPARARSQAERELMAALRGAR
jgi:hypothetical protein